MENYEITDMIIDDEMGIEEYATTDFKQHGKNYRITFKKADLELVNAWVFDDGTSLPADLSDAMIESLREDIKNRI
ncbi:hypothetical protein [Bacillus sp. FJAT-27251]|uniref:hypothetical protein n=1 Tax=Bacillus sp. FJAT-27251 TaxID=1684142 RepID=UPI0006A7BAD7|nr:hypothetical protein [Bacillus sp. FJAT-27251]